MALFFILLALITCVASTVIPDAKGGCKPPALPLLRNEKTTLPGRLNFYVSERRLGATRYPLGESTKVPNFGFVHATELLKPGKKPASLQLQNRQVFTDFSESMAHRSTKDKNTLYFSADSTTIPEAVAAADGCSQGGKKVRILVIPGASTLFYKRFGVNGTVKPGAAISKHAPGLTQVDIEIEMEHH